MSEAAMPGQVQTVLGPVSPEALGPTMMHEHLLIDLRRLFDEPQDPAERALAHAPMTLDNLAWVYRNWARNLDNLVLDDAALAVRETEIFRRAGGRTIVDVSSVGIRRDPMTLRRISEQTGVHVVMGCSYYTAFFHPPDMDGQSEAALYDEIVRDIRDGIDGTDIRAGIIGEIGCTWPLDPNEAKVLRASARASRATGTAITIHPGRHVDSPFQIMDILEAAGADPARVIMGHMERTGLDQRRLLELAQRGCYLEYDWFGEVRPAFPHGRVDVPSDGERIKVIASLVDAGFAHLVLVSQDVCFKSRTVAYGGPGYAHILQYGTVWMRELGIGEQHIEDIIVRNPQRALRLV